MRSAEATALPAFIASRLASRPAVYIMAQHMEAAGLATAAQVMRAYNQRTMDAVHRFKDALPPEIGANIDGYITQASADMVTIWESILNPQGDDTHADVDGTPAPATTNRSGRRPGANLVGPETPEMRTTNTPTPPKRAKQCTFSPR